MVKKKYPLPASQKKDGVLIPVPKITKVQAQKIMEMFRKGDTLCHVQNYLGINEWQSIRKMNCCFGEEWFDSLYKEVVEVGMLLSKQYWLDIKMQKGADIDSKDWQFIMKNEFGWSSNPPFQENRQPIVYNIAKPEEAIDKIIQRAIAGEISMERAKGIAELIYSSYQVRDPNIQLIDK